MVLLRPLTFLKRITSSQEGPVIYDMSSTRTQQPDYYLPIWCYFDPNFFFLILNRQCSLGKNHLSPMSSSHAEMVTQWKRPWLPKQLSLPPRTGSIFLYLQSSIRFLQLFSFSKEQFIQQFFVTRISQHSSHPSMLHSGCPHPLPCSAFRRTQC